MDKQRIFRVLVCFVLICALVVNISPIRAKAVDPVTLTGAAMIGLAACLAAGVVILPQTIELANQFGASFEQQIKDVTIVNVDKDTLWDYYIRMRNKLDNRFSPEWDPGEFHDDLEHALAAGLITAISSIMIAAVATGGFEAPSSEAPEGYAYYNGFLLPELSYPSELPYCLIFTSSDYYYATFSDAPLNWYFRTTDTSSPSLASGNDPVLYTTQRIYYTSTFWPSVHTSFTLNGGYVIGYQGSLIWANYDVEQDPASSSGSSSDPCVVLAASEPTSRPTIFVEPDIYVGDIPQKIQDGEDDPEKLNLPPIDPSRIFTNEDAQLDDYTRLVNDFKDGKLTYDEFVDQYQHKSTTPDPSTPSEPVVDPSDPTEPEDVGPIGDYALDLTEFFPFCIPYDIKEFLSLLSAAPEAPVFEWDIVVKSWDWGFHITVDLSPWNDVAALFRKLELLAFIVGLGFVTREKFLRG